MAGRERVIAASVDLAERGTGLRFTIERGGQTLPAFAIRADGAVRAYVNSCAHQGVELDWMPGEFFDYEREHLICATHGALFCAHDGHCVDGPCRGASLVALTVVERDGAVILIE
jgi:nitrite reductase/ring-hydroxylating ferredoxin subunit